MTLTKREVMALQEAAAWGRRGSPYWWKPKTMASLAEKGLTVLVPAEQTAPGYGAGYLVTEAGRSWLREHEST